MVISGLALPLPRSRPFHPVVSSKQQSSSYYRKTWIHCQLCARRVAPQFVHLRSNITITAEGQLEGQEVSWFIFLLILWACIPLLIPTKSMFTSDRNNPGWDRSAEHPPSPEAIWPWPVIETGSFRRIGSTEYVLTLEGKWDWFVNNHSHKANEIDYIHSWFEEPLESRVYAQGFRRNPNQSKGGRNIVI